MKGSTVVGAFLFFAQIQWAVSLIDPLTLGLTSLAVSVLTYTYSRMSQGTINTKEACDQTWIPEDLNLLNSKLDKRLFGQQIAHSTVIRALKGHMKSDVLPPKALTMSFHGLPGSGKNHVANLIAQSIYKEGQRSSFYHFFNGRAFAPNEDLLHDYKERLKYKIANSLAACPKSMFVFDEVDMMPEGLLDVLVPFLNYVQEVNVHTDYGMRRVETNRAIFIFLSNTGSSQIFKKMVEFWSQGYDRNRLTLNDFENLIVMGAFSEKGGFKKSDTIRTNLIDHYVPFLPLEEEHVKRCMMVAFQERGVHDPSEEMMKEVLSVVTYGPQDYNIYAKSGCKKIEQKVVTVV